MALKFEPESTESVELADKVEATLPTLGVPAKNPSNIEEFNHLHYLQYFAESPEYTKLLQMFENREYGWKSRARQLMKMHGLTQAVADLQEAFFQNTPSAAGRPTRETIRKRLIENLGSLATDVLVSIATEKKIDYQHYLTNDDRTGLIDTIVEVMLAS